jgi:hypothetical protein
MDKYLVNTNTQSNGDHEVHKEDCGHLPKPKNRRFLGYYTGCQDAVREAKKYYRQSNGCFYCCYPCHTS